MIRLAAALYLLVAALCLLRARGRRRGLWRGLALGLAALAMVRWFTLDGRMHILATADALDSGFYAHRRYLQLPLVVAVLAIAGLVIAAVPRLGPRERTALAAVALLAALAAVRAISYHGVDRLLAAGWGVFTFSRLVEFGALAVAAAAAAGGRR